MEPAKYLVIPGGAFERGEFDQEGREMLFIPKKRIFQSSAAHSHIPLNMIPGGIVNEYGTQYDSETCVALDREVYLMVTGGEIDYKNERGFSVPGDHLGFDFGPPFRGKPALIFNSRYSAFVKSLDSLAESENLDLIKTSGRFRRFADYSWKVDRTYGNENNLMHLFEKGRGPMWDLPGRINIAFEPMGQIELRQEVEKLIERFVMKFN